MLKLEQTQKQKQQLIMTHEMKQAIQLLNFNVFELSEFLENEADINMFIEVENPIKNDISTCMENEEYKVRESEENEGDSYFVSSKSGFNDNIARAVMGETLKENLMFQLRFIGVKGIYKEICEYLIDYVDNKGYLNIDEDVMCSLLEIDKDELDFCINTIQCFYPVGVCARSPVERIILQLKKKGLYREEHLILLTTYMENIAYGKINTIHLKTGFDINFIESLIEDIKSCKLNITSQFLQTDDNDLYIYPEIRVTEDNGNVEVSLIEDNSPKIKIDTNAVVDMNQARSDDELLSFYKNYYDKAMFIIFAVEKRKENMLKITKEIFKVQDEFLQKGKLKPLKMSDIAESCEISVSTVSRIVNEKYIDTKRGIFSLKTFFKHSVGKGTKGEDNNVSVDTDIKNAMREIIDNEDKNKPLSDEKISKCLKERGYDISRRTVNKYRGQLNIPSASIRKKD